MNKLYNSSQTKEWMDGYPIGNGRLAAMVWGDEGQDILALNHEWLWRGIYRNKKTESAFEHLNEVREIFKSGDCEGGTRAAVKYFGAPSTNAPIDSYQPAGNLVLSFSNESEFVSRELNLENGIATVNRRVAKSEFYVDCVKDIIIGNWSSDSAFSGTLSFLRCEDKEAECSYKLSQGLIYFYCSFSKGISFGVAVEFETDGKTDYGENGVSFTDATYLRIKANIGTQLKGIEDEIKMPVYDYIIDKQAHTDKFSARMNRVRLSIAESDKYDELAISERIEKVRNGENDNGIAELYFDYGRYLMLSCSICGELPASLQGKWNDVIAPPWGSDYHFDINLQMCYWMCEAVDMTECVKPLIDLLMRFFEGGKRAAKKHYGCRGVLLPLADDVWAVGMPVSRVYGIWVGGAAWMAQHVWWHYTYSGDKSFLEKTAYPYFKAVAEFYEDYLIEDESGVLQVIPSQSPENRFEGATEFDVSLCVSSAMDVQLAYDAFGYAIKTATILGLDDDKIAIWKKMRASLPDFKIGEDGRLLEWNEEKEETEPGHRHLSHLYGVYPSDIFMQKEMKKQYDAARKSLDFRLSHGGGYTGWSRAWASCLYARFGNAQGFYEHFKGLVKDFATVSLLDLHPPRIFQIDGNFGAVAAILESIVSTYDKKVHLLKAVPSEWKSGSLCGVKVPGGHKIDVYWQDGTVKKVNIVFGFENSITIIAGGSENTYSGAKGETLNILFK